MSRPATGAAAAAAALGAWLAVPMLTMRRRGTLDDQQIAAIRGECRVDPTDAGARHRAAVRRARVREAQVRAAIAAVPAPRAPQGQERSPLTW